MERLQREKREKASSLPIGQEGLAIIDLKSGKITRIRYAKGR